jgi:hypothetical protein
LKQKIEETRKKLEQAVLDEEFDTYYPKSLELDYLIEEYLKKVQT